MAVQNKYLSNKDPATMFDDKKAAEEHDAMLEREETLALILENAAKSTSVNVDLDDAHKLARHIIQEQGDDLSAVATKPKVKKRVAQKE